MLNGRIGRIDSARRRAVVVTADGAELSLRFPDDAVIEVMEPETVGTMGGALDDVGAGYLVEVVLGEPGDDGVYPCRSLVCIS